LWLRERVSGAQLIEGKLLGFCSGYLGALPSDTKFDQRLNRWCLLIQASLDGYIQKKF
jgi:hypothetical protein